MIGFAAGLVSEDTALFGHSMNATLVLAAAASSRCAGVIAVAPAERLPPDMDVMKAFWESHAEPERKQRSDAIRAEFDTAEDAAKPTLYARYNHLRYYYDLDRPLIDTEDLASVAAWSQAVLASGVDVDWPATLAAVTAPVLLAVGAFDFVAPPTQWTEGPLRAGWTREVFERSAHCPFEEQPDEFVAAVERWLKTI